MAVELQVPFTGAAGTLLSALTPPWTNLATATLGLSNANAMRQLAGGTALWVCNTAPSVADYRTKLTMRPKALVAGSTHQCGVIFRVQDASNFYMARYNHATTEWQLYKCVAGAFTSLGVNYVAAVADGDVLEGVADGDQISLVLNGTTRVGPVTDTTFTTAGQVGLRWNSPQSETSNSMHGDDFTIETVDAPAGGGSGGGMMMRGVG